MEETLSADQIRINGENKIVTSKEKIALIRSYPDIAQFRIVQKLGDRFSFYGVYFSDMQYSRFDDFAEAKVFPNTLVGYLRAWKYIRQLNPDTILGVSESNVLISTFFFLVRKPVKVFFPYDTKHFRPNDETGFIQRIKTKIALRCERYNFLVADKILHKGMPGGLQDLPFYDRIKNTPIALFREFLDPTDVPKLLNKKLSDADNEIHIVYAGGIYLFSASDAESFWEFYPKITSQGLHFHVYTQVDREVEATLRKLAGEDPYFHYEGFLPNAELIRRLQKYDYGIHMFGNGLSGKKELILKSAFSNKDYDYLKAGLPILTCSDLAAVTQWVQSNHIGLSIEYNSELTKLKSILESIDYATLVQNVKQFVKRGDAQQVKELGDFLRVKNTNR